jgi:hypothetical protein
MVVRSIARMSQAPLLHRQMSSRIAPMDLRVHINLSGISVWLLQSPVRMVQFLVVRVEQMIVMAHATSALKYHQNHPILHHLSASKTPILLCVGMGM